MLVVKAGNCKMFSETIVLHAYVSAQRTDSEHRNDLKFDVGRGVCLRLDPSTVHGGIVRQIEDGETGKRQRPVADVGRRSCRHGAKLYRGERGMEEDGAEERRIKVSVNGKSGENKWRGVCRM